MSEQRYDNAAFTAPGPQLPMLPPARVVDIDPNAAVRQALSANNALVDNLLRSIQPSGPDLDGGNLVGTYSTPSDSAARTARYKFAVGAILVICMTIAGGVVLLAYRAGTVDGFGGFAMWLALTGILAAGFVTWLQTRDMHYSPEGIAHAQASYQAIVDQTDAESRQAIAQAVAYGIRTDADAKARTTASQAKALDAEVQRLMLAAPAPPVRRVTVAGSAQPQAWEWDANGNPVLLPEPENTPVPPVPPVCPLLPPPVPTGVETTMGVVLGWVAGLYDEPDRVHPDTRRIINTELPWSARSKALAEAEKPRVKAALLGSGLFAPLPGNGLALECTIKGVALRRVREVLG